MSVMIETPRLLLRQPDMGDWKAFAGFLGSDRAGFLGGPYDQRTAWRSFAAITGQWQLLGYGLFVATLKDKGTAVGSAGPWHPPYYPEPEIAWSVWSQEHEGKGYAFEAAFAARNWACETLGHESYVSYIDTGNTRSAALAQRLGCVIDPDAPRIDAETVSDYDIWRHPAPDSDGHPEAYA